MDLKTSIDRIKELEGRHVEVIQRILEADNGNVSAIDFVGVAALNRSLSIIAAFLQMLKTKNVFVGNALIRLQLDSLMRFNACRFVDDPSKLLQVFLEDKDPKNIKSIDGQPLTDGYLHKKLAEDLPWVSKVYKGTSGFIHLSGRHITATVQNVDKEKRSVDFSFNPLSMEWQAPYIEEAAECFTQITEELLALAISYILAKDKIDLNDLLDSKI